MPCHHALAEALHAYIAAAGIAEDRKGWLFRTNRGHDATVLCGQPMNQSDAWRMIRRRAVTVGVHAPIGNHTFRATGITAYLANGGALEHAQEMAAHEKPAHDQALRPREGAAHARRSRGDTAQIQRTSGKIPTRASALCCCSAERNRQGTAA
jgi:integrase